MPVRRTVPSSAISAARRLLLGHADVALSPFAARTVVTVIDASHLKAKRGGAGAGPSPVDRGKLGSKHQATGPDCL